MSLINKGLNAAYVTKNSAPRQAFLSLLSENNARRRVDIEHLFRSPFGLNKAKSNDYDCLIVDEAHRLVKKMVRDVGGENQEYWRTSKRDSNGRLDGLIVSLPEAGIHGLCGFV